MPLIEDLSELLTPLTRLNGLEIRHTRFNSDVDRLIHGIVVIFDERAIEDDKLSKSNRLIGEQTGDDGIENNQASMLAHDDISKTTRQQIVLILTLGWFISGIVFWVIYN